MKILLLTSIYPSEDKPRGFTPVVHYFAREWVKMGYEVKVIHNQTKFPFLFYLSPKFIKNYLESRLGFGMPNYRMTKEKKYSIDGVLVHRIPLRRIFPKIKFFKYSLKSQVEKIISSNLKEGFIPDVILSHWAYPQLNLIVELKKNYNCITSLVFHSNIFKEPNSINLINQIDVVGFRSKNLRNEFNELYNGSYKSFLCYSGIRKESIIDLSIDKHKKKIGTFIFVGNLIKRKFPDLVIKCFLSLQGVETRNLLIIGEGPEKQKLLNICSDSIYSNNINFLGQIDREEVLNYMQMAECFIMVSENEIFGLVYIEAMAKGCIVIAAKNEGIDGVIKHGENGFLCNSGDIDELKIIINEIDRMSIDEKNEIAQNAIKTALKLTEYSVANEYINKVISINKNQ